MKAHSFKDVTMCEISATEILNLCKRKAAAANLPTDTIAVIIDLETGSPEEGYWNLALQADPKVTGIELRNGHWIMLKDGDVSKIKEQMLQKDSNSGQ